MNLFNAIFLTCLVLFIIIIWLIIRCTYSTVNTVVALTLDSTVPMRIHIFFKNNICLTGVVNQSDASCCVYGGRVWRKRLLSPLKAIFFCDFTPDYLRVAGVIWPVVYTTDTDPDPWWGPAWASKPPGPTSPPLLPFVCSWTFTSSVRVRVFKRVPLGRRFYPTTTRRNQR